jgi:hypothetical protein
VYVRQFGGLHVYLCRDFRQLPCYSILRTNSAGRCCGTHWIIFR